MAHAVTIKRLSKSPAMPVFFVVLKFPQPPKKKGLREFIEKCAMDNYSFPVYWYSETKTNFAHKY